MSSLKYYPIWKKKNIISIALDTLPEQKTLIDAKAYLKELRIRFKEEILKANMTTFENENKPNLRRFLRIQSVKRPLYLWRYE